MDIVTTLSIRLENWEEDYMGLIENSSILKILDSAFSLTEKLNESATPDEDNLSQS